jgi:hypothetical protein
MRAGDWTGGQIERFSYRLGSFPASRALARNVMNFINLITKIKW